MKATYKIVFFILMICIPFATVHAQNKTKKKSAAAHAKKKKTITKKPVKQISAVTAPAVLMNTVRQKATDNILKDSTPKTVIITSSFKPTLRNAAKINFTASAPILDTTRIPLTYNIPSQNLFFSYQPIAIKPLALSIDTGFHWENNKFIKAGLGNYSTPYIETGMAFGDGQNSTIRLDGKYISSKGNLPFQQYSQLHIGMLGIFNTAKDNEITARVFLDNSLQYKYGYQPDTLKFTKDQLEQQFNNVGIELGLRNKAPTDFGITYHPQIHLNYFSDNKNAQELDFVGKAALNKAFGRLVAFDISATADITKLNVPLIPNPLNITNNLFYINPTIQFHTPDVKLYAGIQPSWDNQVFSMLPNFTAEAKIKDEKFIFQAGWVGYYNKNTYQSLSAFNPWIDEPTQLQNTKVQEEYAGFKGSAGKHLTYNARISFLQINNQALFVNDTAKLNNQSFKVLYEPQLQGLRLHGEIGYSDHEKLSMIAALTFTQYTNEAKYNKPYGLLPLELTGTLRYKILKDLHLKSDIFFWDGANYQTNHLQSQKSPAALDFNLGAEFTVLPKLNLWLQFNNLLNSHYQRWNQYDVLGFNVLGGVVYSFH
jgi:hypothetical protein